MYQRIPDRWGTSRQPHHLPRLLIEDDHPALVVSDYSVFRRAGFEVALCSGPTVSPEECPLLRGEPCGLLEGADVVLHALPQPGAVADAIRRSRPEVDLVEFSRDGSRPTPGRGAGELDPTASLDAQIQAVSHALTHAGVSVTGHARQP